MRERDNKYTSPWAHGGSREKLQRKKSSRYDHNSFECQRPNGKRKTKWDKELEKKIWWVEVTLGTWLDSRIASEKIVFEIWWQHLWHLQWKSGQRIVIKRVTAPRLSLAKGNGFLHRKTQRMTSESHLGHMEGVKKSFREKCLLDMVATVLNVRCFCWSLWGEL